MTSRTSEPRTTWWSAAVVAAVSFVVLGPLAPEASAQTEPAGSDAAQELADEFAPIMMLKAQAYPCDTNGEMYAPTTVDIVLDNPEIMLREVSIGNPLVKSGPTASDLFGLGEGFFLDFPGEAVDPGCLYEKDFDEFNDGRRAVVYAHIARQDDHPDLLALQYYFYWYFNDFNNKHESDWEGIQLLFEASSVEEALASEPIEVAYAQHEGGELADWDSSKLQREGTRPVVHSSRGSHASYYGSAIYLGRRGNQGFGCDDTDTPSTRVDPEVVVLPDSVDDPDDPLAWLNFEGRWGERRTGSFNGPTGPVDKERWLQPVDWQDGLRSSSVVIPTGDTQADSVISGFCTVVGWGSNKLIELTTSPARLLITAGLIFVVVAWMAGRTDWSRVAPTPLRRRRRAGQIIRISANRYRHSALALATIGLVYIPITALGGIIGRLVTLVPFVADLRDLAGSRSGTSLVLAILVSSTASLIGYVAVNAMVAAHTSASEAGDRPSGFDAARTAWGRRNALAAGFLRSLLIVGVLLISVVGIPWGIRQLVRYQLMPQAVVLEGLSGRDALARSSELVRGRWWHTATVVALINLLLAGSGLVAGLLCLVLFANVPLWFVSGLITLIYALVVPIGAVAMTMLYGDRVAQQEQGAPADLLPV